MAVAPVEEQNRRPCLERPGYVDRRDREREAVVVGVGRNEPRAERRVAWGLDV